MHDTDERFTRPLAFNLRDYLTEHCFNGIHGAPITVRLRAHNTTARIFRERTFHPSQRLIEGPRDTLRSSSGRRGGGPETTTIEMRVAGERGLVRFILSWSPDVEVLDPPDLRREVAAALGQALARLGAAEK